MLGLAVAVIAVAGIAQTTRVAGETAHAVAAAAKSPTTLAKIGAQAARQKFDLPYTVDDNTTLEAIEADGPAVRYSYSVHGLDPALLTADALKAVAVPRLCTTPATRNLLEKHVAVDYVWHIEESGDDLVFEITDADC
ncbi:hypothetical protein GCM10027515_07880 [Schumannella luteola]|nr:hypothetical protein FJ656_25810 [Schumannella luteola]